MESGVRWEAFVLIGEETLIYLMIDFGLIHNYKPNRKYFFLPRLLPGKSTTLIFKGHNVMHVSSGHMKPLLKTFLSENPHSLSLERCLIPKDLIETNSSRHNPA